MPTNSAARSGRLVQLWYRVFSLDLRVTDESQNLSSHCTTRGTGKDAFVSEGAQRRCRRTFGGKSVSDVPTVEIL